MSKIFNVSLPGGPGGFAGAMTPGRGSSKSAHGDNQMDEDAVTCAGTIINTVQKLITQTVFQKSIIVPQRKSIILPILAAILILVFTACDDGNNNGNGNNGNGDKTAITYTISQIGGTANTADTTGLSFTFSSSIDALNVSVSDITLTGSAEKGSAAFTGSGVNWSLSPITVNSAGSVTVKIIKDGITETTLSASIHKAVTGTCCADPNCDGSCHIVTPPCTECGDPNCDGSCHIVTPPCTECGDPNCDGNCNIVIQGGVAINRDHSTTSAFVFSVEPVNGATVYNVYKGADVVASSATPAVISVSQGLNRESLTPLTVKAENAGGDTLWSADLQGMLKYSADTPTKDAYTDWFRFFEATRRGLRGVDRPSQTPHTTFLNNVETALSLGRPVDEDSTFGGKWYDERWKQECNNAMSPVLRNYAAILEFYKNTTDPVDNAVENLATIEEVLPRLWFNKVTGNADSNFGHFDNDAALNNMMKAEFPDVDIS